MAVPSLPKVKLCQDIEFTYTDSGAPDTDNYMTFILVHGHTYHAGVFQKLGPLAKSSSVRIICVNRREYTGSTPHTPEELGVYQAGNDAERTTLMNGEGVNLALCIESIIYEQKLGHVALVGWSLGNTFTLAVMASIPSLPDDSKKRLQKSIKTFILWDPPSHALGIEDPPNPYVPLYDMTILDDTGVSTALARGQEFGKWVESYFSHPAFTEKEKKGSHNEKDLDRKIHGNPSRPPTFYDLPFPELLAMVDFSVGDKCDTILTEPTFNHVVEGIVDKALFEPKTREAWGHPKVAYMWGEANPWNVPWAAWNIQERVKNAQGNAPITFHAIDGANHFVMWDDEKKALGVLIQCTKA
ncbi:Alpha/Beta hydrolase protein [Mycena rosella]|uniref:Alpha/Beta hydrolase protein n=1 Tax=Mycena rosella TaxID=1033263 RepID=A0AAD7G3Q0_MYCRO|nr:Alpha/Beta hydrolase protein [Mycena rosella]